MPSTPASKHAVGVNSCTAGMHLALLACGIGPGDEVITSALTFASTANVIVHTGATPVLADICIDDLNIDPADVERRVTPRTKAIMPVVYAGQPCRIDEILAVARRHNLKFIEDAATGVGAKYRGRPVGSYGDASVFSFYSIKNMTTGEGGMVTTDDPAIAERVSILRNQGMDSNAWKRYSASGTPFYTVEEPGFNYRMTDMHASLGLHQLAKVDAYNRRRAELAAHYTRLFSDVPGVETPAVRPEVESNWHLYVIRLRDVSVPRNEVIERLKAKGIGSAVHYLPRALPPLLPRPLRPSEGRVPRDRGRVRAADLAAPLPGHDRARGRAGGRGGQGEHMRLSPQTPSPGEGEGASNAFEPYPEARRRPEPDAVQRRLFDIGIATIGLVVFSPLMALIGVLIKLESPGPVFFRQKRVGKDGRLFEIFKFRSMRQSRVDEQTVPDVEDIASFKFRPVNFESRVTAIGRTIRACSLDELPNLLNVLKGDMHLVGPRPDEPELVSQLPSRVHGERSNVKPGITGLAQINGRTDLTYQEMMAYDLDYVNEHPFARDIRIMLKTLRRRASQGRGPLSRTVRPSPAVSTRSAA